MRLFSPNKSGLYSPNLSTVYGACQWIAYDMNVAKGKYKTNVCELIGENMLGKNKFGQKNYFSWRLLLAVVLYRLLK